MKNEYDPKNIFYFFTFSESVTSPEPILNYAECKHCSTTVGIEIPTASMFDK